MTVMDFMYRYEQAAEVIGREKVRLLGRLEMAVNKEAETKDALDLAKHEYDLAVLAVEEAQDELHAYLTDTQ